MLEQTFPVEELSTLWAKQLEKEFKMQSKELIKSQKDLVATHCTRGAAEDSETVALEERRRRNNSYSVRIYGSYVAMILSRIYRFLTPNKCF